LKTLLDWKLERRDEARMDRDTQLRFHGIQMPTLTKDFDLCHWLFLLCILATARGGRLFCHCAWRAFILPLRVAAARNRFDWFPAPSYEQALRPAPVINASGSPMPVGHASAVIDE
jgi:hypothetical protein